MKLKLTFIMHFIWNSITISRFSKLSKSQTCKLNYWVLLENLVWLEINANKTTTNKETTIILWEAMWIWLSQLATTMKWLKFNKFNDISVFVINTKYFFCFSYNTSWKNHPSWDMFLFFIYLFIFFLFMLILTLMI